MELNKQTMKEMDFVEGGLVLYTCVWLQVMDGG